MAHGKQLLALRSFLMGVGSAAVNLRTSAAGALIANSRGVPGTLGCFGRTRDGTRVLLTAWHVLFGRGANERRAIWMIDQGDRRRSVYNIGQSLRGAIGTVLVDGEHYYLDCAIASTTGARAPLLGWGGWMPSGRAVPGETVSKIGGGSGVTTGTVVDVCYLDVACIENRTYTAPRQILIRGANGSAFSAEGDSGAAVVNANGQVVGLLWGTTSSGEGIACHIRPVLQALDISLATDGLDIFRKRLAYFIRRRRFVNASVECRHFDRQ